MDLIERYIQDVSHRLPRRLRGDVEKELRSSLEDALDAHAANAGDGAEAAAPDEHVVELLRKFGPPAQLAASYRSGTGFLVGPELYPAFLKTMKIVIIVIVGIVVASVVAGAIGEDNPLFEIAKGLVLSNLFSEIVEAMGWVVLVFWIVQLVTSSSRVDTPNATRATSMSWDPHTLPRRDDPNRIGRTGLMVEIAIMIALIVLFAVFPRAVGATVSTNGERHWVALMGPGFLAGRGLLYVGFVGTVVLNVMLLRHNRWTIPTRVFDLAISVIFIAALLPMVTGGNVVANAPADLVANGWSEEAADSLSRDMFPFLDKLLRGVFACVIVGIVWSMVTRVVTLIRRVT
ncbi:MAG: hypothetical protein OEN01_08630 [Candidatus Krumholzibacteria bacterium]|nr:hypothetical protein [Candidatus Krumholzibacteria bacterium]